MFSKQIESLDALVGAPTPNPATAMFVLADDEPPSLSLAVTVRTYAPLSSGVNVALTPAPDAKAALFFVTLQE